MFLEQHVDEFAKAAEEMVAPAEVVRRAKVIWDFIGEDEVLRSCLTEPLAIDLVWDGAHRAQERAERWMQLSKLVVTADVSAPGLEFLKRVSRCYVYGFDAE